MDYSYRENGRKMLMLHFRPFRYTFNTVWTIICMKLTSKLQKQIAQGRLVVKALSRKTDSSCTYTSPKHSPPVINCSSLYFPNIYCIKTILQVRWTKNWTNNSDRITGKRIPTHTILQTCQLKLCSNTEPLNSISIRTAKFNSKKPAFFPRSIFTCSIWFNHVTSSDRSF
jgi:hypothetical protein